MYESVQPDDAARALTEIGHRQEQVINLSIIPNWYWWAMAVLMALSALLFDVGELSARRHIAIAPDHASAAQCAEPE